MAQLVLAAAGAAIAGPLGFAWQTGWLVGSMLGSALFPQKTQGPRLDDRTIVGTEYGQAIPWVAGAPRLAGQYIWASPLREIANTQRAGKGGGAKVTTYTYECDVMIILTENVTEGVARDWLNGELVRNGVTIKDGIWNGVTVYTGAADQLPDPTYEAAVGAGNAPAYRGRTTIVIRGLQLGGGKQLPNLEHQVSVPFIDDRVRLLLNFPDADKSDQSKYQLGEPYVFNGGQMVLADGYIEMPYRPLQDNHIQFTDASLFSASPAGDNRPVTYEMIVEVSADYTNSSSTSLGSMAPIGSSGAALPLNIEYYGVDGTLGIIASGPGGGISHPFTWFGSTSIKGAGPVHIAVEFSGLGSSIWVNGARVRDKVGYPNDTTVEAAPYFLSLIHI